ncbi:MAG TPA: hypothetical protein VFE62_07855 [Gemmataceae bacterium]|nr:hypothetical protein [Gemmataceae bacterium]
MNANAQDRPAPKRSMVAELEATKKSFPQGTVPSFRLKLKNTGKEAEKVLKLRGDLQDAYYDLEVTQNGKPVSVPRAISDPGPTSDADYLTLKPGEVVTFELTKFASMWEVLPVGAYSATVRVWLPGQAIDKSYSSSSAMFEFAK